MRPVSRRLFSLGAALLALSLPVFAGTPVVTPEPGTWLLMGAGVTGMLFLHRKRSRSRK
jgi:PEP-CTERM motif-containing protein